MASPALSRKASATAFAAAACCESAALGEPASRGAGTLRMTPTTAASARRRSRTVAVLTAGSGAKEGVEDEPKSETKAIGGGQPGHTLPTAAAAYLDTSRRSCNALASTCTATSRGLVTLAAVMVSAKETAASGAPDGDGDAPLLRDEVGELETRGEVDDVGEDAIKGVTETLAPKLLVGDAVAVGVTVVVADNATGLPEDGGVAAGVGVAVPKGDPEAVAEALAESSSDEEDDTDDPSVAV